jgi:hypothetical protein
MGFHVTAAQIGNKPTDTIDITSRIKERMRSFKQQNKVQIYKYENSDSTILFGSNKQRSFLTSVMILDKVRNENRWFYFDSLGVFRVTIAERKRTQMDDKKKKSTSSYYFENTHVIYKIEEDKKYNTSDLINEAKRYQELAIPHLKK